MAKITVIGIQKFRDDIKAMGEDSAKMTVEMLKAGSSAAEEEWRKGIESETHKIINPDGKGYISKRGYIDTGDMLESVGTVIEEKKRRAKVYPLGYDGKGVPNAEKAFVLNYGTSSYKGSRFVDEINEKADIEVPVAMAKVMDEYLKKHNL